MSVNRHILVGHLGKDPEVRYLNSGAAVTSFSVATTYKPKNGEERTSWHNVVVYGNSAEPCGQHLRKGSKVFVDGRVETRSYEDKIGNKRYITETIANHVEFLSGGPSGERKAAEPDDRDDVDPF